MKNPFHPPPAPPGSNGGAEIPEGSASILSCLFLHWLSPLLGAGFSRPLEQDDLWSLPHSRSTSHLTDELERNFYSTRSEDERGDNLSSRNADQEVNSEDKEKTNIDVEEVQEKPDKSRLQVSLPKVLHRQFFWQCWYTGFLILIGQTLTTLTPLVTKVLLTWLTDSYVFSHLSPAQQSEAPSLGLTKPQGIGYGVGIAIGLFVMQQGASLINAHSSKFAMSLGLSVRTAIIGCITRKSLRLSARARLEHSSGQILTMISTDSDRVDKFCIYGHHLWIAPAQLSVTVALLIATLGYSALVGLGVLIFSLPIQTVLVLIMMKQRQKGVKITDSRIRLTTEVLQGIRLLKLYAWEKFYAGKITELRKRELETIKNSLFATAGLIAMMTFIPILASVLSFITYALTGHDLDVATIFTSLQFFNIIQLPLIMLPVTLASLSDLFVAITRISAFLVAEERPAAYAIKLDEYSDNGVECKGDFAWDVSSGNRDSKAEQTEDVAATLNVKKEEAERKQEKKAEKRAKRAKEEVDTLILPMSDPGQPVPDTFPSVPPEPPPDQPFQLKDLDLTIRKGAFVAIVGRVGSGKSSILQALTGEMRKSSGEVRFRGSFAYVPQSPWIQNATVRDNIMFGQPENMSRLNTIIHACSLTQDLDAFPNGIYTIIGEKGVNISGGQKARISLARAAYSGSDIVLLDDPLSAVDSHVGQDILQNCLLSGPLADKTRILVTNGLHFLDKTDYICIVEEGIIKERGTYQDLVNTSDTFAGLMSAHAQNTSARVLETPVKREFDIKKLVDDPLIQAEERNIGAVTWATYKQYFTFSGGLAWVPVIFVLLALVQSCQVATTLLLGFWTAHSIPNFGQNDYIALYASFGAGQALFSFLLTCVFGLIGIRSSLNLFASALKKVLISPVSFFDTTPIGRILSRLSKDQDKLDTDLPLTMMQKQFLTTVSSVIGTVGLVFYTFPLLGIIFAPMGILYWFMSSYYRRSSVEVKRLDSLARSNFYSSFSETLTGITTVRAYRLQNRSMKTAELGLDLENRAYYITVSLQWWLMIRLELFASIVILGIALFAAGFRNSVNPSKIGVVLTYTLQEMSMNSVERLLIYTELPSEEVELTKPHDVTNWPTQGEIEFKNVDMVYRGGLPLVLKSVTFHIKAGEKVAIVGRTGAGKSSLLQALFRIVEIQRGSISIDGREISGVDLETLRTKLALVPQDSVLFLGTLRQNLDPLGIRTDAELIAILQSACLLPKDISQNTLEQKFSLDHNVDDEGSNFSAGEKQLLALCRALVKNSKIIVLDEATSSVDAETDAKIQETIQSEFASSTLLCIAHRIHTIVHYDRVLVMDSGKVAQYGTVLELYDCGSDSIFRSLCEESGISRTDIVRLRATREW
ncbi:multidrug resistance-associated ABC transporter [Lentinula aciculospora]|uniref:Multidrug resistance-associated ABC transporter n=1 Tax=Lentinula aciculospora TaxID=153920 RepID=A0A9W9A5V5_9AGAR|nr:multidrug resistance-associated ABC transporter [Lentinula aciculospora]